MLTKHYPIINHSNYRSQFLVLPFWNPYLCKPCLPFASYHSIQLMHVFQDGLMKLYNFSLFSHNFSKFPMQFHILINEYFNENTKPFKCLIQKMHICFISLLRSINGTNSNHLKKYLIITKTYQLCHTIKFNGSSKFKLHMSQPYPWARDQRNGL